MQKLKNFFMIKLVVASWGFIGGCTPALDESIAHSASAGAGGVTSVRELDFKMGQTAEEDQDLSADVEGSAQRNEAFYAQREVYFSFFIPRPRTESARTGQGEVFLSWRDSFESKRVMGATYTISVVLENNQRIPWIGSASAIYDPRILRWKIPIQQLFETNAQMDHLRTSTYELSLILNLSDQDILPLVIRWRLGRDSFGLNESR